MGGGNRERQQAQQAQTNYNNALTGAQQESPYEQRRRRRAEEIDNWINAGDFRNAPNSVRVFTNYADPAERKRRREVLSNTRGTGVSALGAGANPNLLALNKQHMDDVDERDGAREYQQGIARAAGAAYDELGDLQSADQAKKLSVLGTTAGVNSSHVSRPKSASWIEKLLGGASMAASAAGSLGWAPLAGGLREGGRTDKYIGKRVLVGEDGVEMLVNDDGTTEPLGEDGPEVIQPDRPGFVVPNDKLPFEFKRDRNFRAGRRRSYAGPEVSAAAFDQAFKPAESDPADGGGTAAGGLGLLPEHVRRTLEGKPVIPGVHTDHWGTGAVNERTGQQVQKPDAPDAPAAPAPAAARPAAPPALNPPLDGRQGHDRRTDEPPPGLEAGRRPWQQAVSEHMNKGGVTAAGPATAAATARPGAAAPPASDPREEALGKLDSQLAHENANPARDKNGRLKSGLLRAAQDFLVGAGGGRGLAGGLGGAIYGGTTGALDPAADERMAQQRRVAKLEKQRAGEAARVKEALERDEQRVGTSLKAAQEKYWREQKPREVDGRLLKGERDAVLAELRLKKGTELAADDPVVAKAERAGMKIDVAAFNNAKGNVVRYVETDPADPTRTRTVERNVVTGDETDLGQKGFQQPVGPDGMTAFQREQLKLGIERVGMQAERLALDTQKFLLETSSGITASAKRAFEVETEPLQKELTAKLGEIKHWQTQFEANKVPFTVAERHVKEIEGRVKELQAQIEGARSRALSTRGNVPASGAKPQTNRWVDRKKFRAQNPEFKGASDAEVDAALSGYGLRGRN